MLIKQGRIFALDVFEAIEEIKKQYGEGELSIRLANVQPRKDRYWFEFCIELENEP